ncbi:DUF4344 domain-containing metallopeptidase [Streptomyces sp. ID05-04B]|uniref:DUF4344 domain-containing metallopeptidase n=1 Tax=Streptomyces sp. ID05-04B TaxID=3028661 RepID=UPI0029C2CB55|nr:DUF4344 domain-containing metallopeptidase [Streptomyces sp. ID05-04B]MDX5566020.1 DUF4344 domain-containing metallopeptidase [Streptomyces sp. ID05-04B]
MRARTTGRGDVRSRKPARAAPHSATLSLCVVLTALATGCRTGTADAPSAVSSSVTVRYEQPSGADRGDAAFLRTRKLPEAAAAGVGALVALDPPVVMVLRSCGGEGSAYDPGARRMEICYEEISETRDLYRAAGQRASDDVLSAVMLETLFHESAHAVLDVLDLPLSAREEDRADQFAALMLLREGAEGERRLLSAARTWRLSAIIYENADDGRQDDHSTDEQRAVNHLCYLYGADPARHTDLVGPRSLPARRARGCEREWKRVQTAWTDALGAETDPTSHAGS